MYSDLTDKERYTAMVGFLCALTSLLFVNPNLEPYGIHPRDYFKQQRGSTCFKLSLFVVLTKESVISQLSSL